MIPVEFLHAVVTGDLKVVKSTTAIDIVQTRDRHDNTALILASRKDRLGVVGFLLDKISVSDVNSYGWTALQ